MTHWDDVRFVLALARNGTIRAAAKSLAVNHTTVSRRIAALEKLLSARLFEQTPYGYVLTNAGKVISQAAEGMEDLLLRSQKQIEGADTELSGEVHINIPDIFDEWVSEKLALFSQQHPKMKINLVSETAVANLSKREADIALRFTQNPPQDMVGHKVWTLPVAVYASTDFTIDKSKALASYPWVRWAPEFSQSPVEEWTDKITDGVPAVFKVTTYKTLSCLIRSGAGIGCLCPWFAQQDPKLQQISPLIEEAELDVWLLIHPDLRGVKRIKVLKDLLANLFANKTVLPDI